MREAARVYDRMEGRALRLHISRHKVDERRRSEAARVLPRRVLEAGGMRGHRAGLIVLAIRKNQRTSAMQIAALLVASPAAQGGSNNVGSLKRGLNLCSGGSISRARPKYNASYRGIVRRTRMWREQGNMQAAEYVCVTGSYYGRKIARRGLSTIGTRSARFEVTTCPMKMKGQQDVLQAAGTAKKKRTRPAGVGRRRRVHGQRLILGGAVVARRPVSSSLRGRCPTRRHGCQHLAFPREKPAHTSSGDTPRTRRRPRTLEQAGRRLSRWGHSP